MDKNNPSDLLKQKQDEIDFLEKGLKQKISAKQEKIRSLQTFSKQPMNPTLKIENMRRIQLLRNLRFEKEEEELVELKNKLETLKKQLNPSLFEFTPLSRKKEHKHAVVKSISRKKHTTKTFKKKTTSQPKKNIFDYLLPLGERYSNKFPTKSSDGTQLFNKTLESFYYKSPPNSKSKSNSYPKLVFEPLDYIPIKSKNTKSL